MDCFAGLFDGFYGKSTSKADKFDILGSMKILNTPLTQKRSGIRSKRQDKPPRQKRVQLEQLGG